MCFEKRLRYINELDKLQQILNLQNWSMQLLEQTNDVRGNLAVMFGNYCDTRVCEGKLPFSSF